MSNTTNNTIPGEENAKVVIVKKKHNLEATKRKRKPAIPNKNGVDRVTVLSQSDVHVEINCRFLYKDTKPKENISIRIPLPRRASIENRIRRRNPDIKPNKLAAAVDKWLRKYLKQKIKKHWRSHKAAQEELFVDEDIGDLD